MTVHPEKLAARSKADKVALLTPLRPVRNRTSEVIDRISNEISSGRLKPGGRLPTEQEMMNAMGVSRTVVREAVSALKADGLVITRQGAGASSQVIPCVPTSDRGRIPRAIARSNKARSPSSHVMTRRSFDIRQPCAVRMTSCS